jgi:hypothetical protein
MPSALPPAVTTVIGTVPTPLAVGTVTVISLSLTLVIVPALDPKSTALAAARFRPVMVTVFPPLNCPASGLTETTNGGPV